MTTKRTVLVRIAITLASAAVGAVAPVTVGAARAEQQKVDAETVQSTAPRLTFEVASVRVNRSGALPFSLGTKGRTYTATNAPLRYLVAAAYAVPVGRVVGGPSWLGSSSIDMRSVGGDRFDILATLPESGMAGHVPSMLRALLTDRFKLVAHAETRDAPIYALVVSRRDGRLGPRLRKAAVDCGAIQAAGQALPRANPGERGLCATEIGGELVGRGQRLSALARMLSSFAGRPVADQTGLTGGFDFDVRFPELDTPADGRATGDAGGGIFTAVEEQLGLKLESIRGPLEFVVVDSADQPTEN